MRAVNKDSHETEMEEACVIIGGLFGRLALGTWLAVGTSGSWNVFGFGNESVMSKMSKICLYGVRRTP